MQQERLLQPEQLKCDCQPEVFDFETTGDIEPFDEGIMGQQRAVRAMDLGMRVKQEGYNIFMSGLTGTGKTTYAHTVADKQAKERETPGDLCYVFNFQEPETPVALNLPTGTGSCLQRDMDRAISDLKEEIPEIFSGDEYEQQKKEIMSQYQQQSNQLMEEFESEIREEGFTLRRTEQGPVPVPLDEEGKAMEQEDFQQLDEEKRKELREQSQDIQNRMDRVMRRIRNLKSEAQEQLKEKEKKMALQVIKPVIGNLKAKYGECQAIIDYLNGVQQDITDNLGKFTQDQQEKQLPFPFKQQNDGSFFTRYQVNLLVDNQDLEGAPVVYEPNPTYYNLFGKIEGKSRMGTVSTDFTMIKEGAVHQANGGYLILKARDVLSNPFSWETLKRTLINQELMVENIGEQYQTIPISTLKPEAFDIDIKVIMIGNPYIYQLLYNYDEEFQKLFKIRADFDVEMKRTRDHMEDFASFIASVSQRAGIKHFTDKAVSRVIEYSSRLTGFQDKLSTRFNILLELLYEANAWSGDNQYVTGEDVQQAIVEKENRDNLAEEKIQEMIERGLILVDVKGETVGQINGLSVYQTGQYSFGRPTRITARTFQGQEGVTNIEREAKLSGKVHNKGVLILSGYLGGKYAGDKPLTLSASLAFEQSYGGVDGDSASLAELIALLSSLAEIPVKQELAITGSMNQKGEVQPIGGVNQKIEGFYRVCQSRGLTGNQGVVIPRQNLDNLMLKQGVIDAVAAGDFNIYQVENIDQALELMLGQKAEEVHQQVASVLEEYADRSQKEGEEEKEEE